MGNWWPAKGRGLIFGLWTCHQYIGDIVAALAAGLLLNSGYDYRWYVPHIIYFVCQDGVGNVQMAITVCSKCPDFLEDEQSVENPSCRIHALTSPIELLSTHDRCLIIPAVLNGVWAFINFTQVPSTPEEFG